MIFYVSEMQTQRVIALTDEQRQTTLNRWFDILELEDIKEVVSEKHPSFKKEDVKKYSLKIVTNFGDHYWVYRGTHKKTKKYYFCIVHATKFVVLNLRACSAYYHMFKDDIDVVKGYDMNAVAQVFLCTTFTVAEGVRTHVPSDIFPCLYRFVPLPDLYVLIGSKNPNSVFGLAYDYSISRDGNTKHSNGLEYASIHDTDIIARMLNANENDVITHKRLLWENGTVYSEIYRRTVRRTSANLNYILPDGKCFGNMNFNDNVPESNEDLVEKDNDAIVKEVDEPEEEIDEDSSDIDYVPEEVQEDDDDDDYDDDD